MGNISNEKNLTLKGLKIVTIAYLILFSSSALSLILTTTDSRSSVYGLIISLGFISLISLAVIYYGIHFIYKGNKEFTEEHERNTLIARKLVTFGIFSYLFSIFFISPFLIGIFANEYFIILNIFQSLLLIPFWLALVYLIKEIVSDTIKTLLWFAFFSRLVLYIISKNSYKIGESLNIVSQTNLNFVFLVYFIAIIPSFIFIYCYYSTYVRIKNNEFLAE